MQPETQKNSVDLLGFVDFTEHAMPGKKLPTSPIFLSGPFRPAQVIGAQGC